MPVVALAVPSALLLIRETRAAAPQRLDVKGAALLIGTFLALVVPLIEGRELGWPIWTALLLVTFLPLAWTFWRYEQRLAGKGGDPLIDPQVLRVPGEGVGVLEREVDEQAADLR